MTAMITINEAETSNRVILRAFHRAHACVSLHHTLRVQSKTRAAAAADMFVELLLEALAEQVQSEGVDTWVGEGQDAGSHAGDEVRHGRVHFSVVVGAVQVDDMTREPTDSKEAHEH